MTMGNQLRKSLFPLPLQMMASPGARARAPVCEGEKGSDTELFENTCLKIQASLNQEFQRLVACELYFNQTVHRAHQQA